MAITTIIQGQSRINKWNADTTGNTFDAIEIELTKNNKSVIKWRWPDTEGFENMTKDGNLFWFNLTTPQSLLLLGNYSLEYAYITGGNAEEKNIVPDFLYVKEQGV